VISLRSSANGATARRFWYGIGADFFCCTKGSRRENFESLPIEAGARTAMIDATELAMWLDGIDVQRVKRPPLWEPPVLSR
jgi:hypothetical protein